MSKPAHLTDREIAVITKALADPRRFRILSEIASVETLCCQAVREAQDVSAATISHHLKELEGAGLVEIVRSGKFASLRFRGDNGRDAHQAIKTVTGSATVGPWQSDISMTVAVAVGAPCTPRSSPAWPATPQRRRGRAEQPRSPSPPSAPCEARA